MVHLVTYSTNIEVHSELQSQAVINLLTCSRSGLSTSEPQAEPIRLHWPLLPGLYAAGGQGRLPVGVAQHFQSGGVCCVHCPRTGSRLGSPASTNTCWLRPWLQSSHITVHSVSTCSLTSAHHIYIIYIMYVIRLGMQVLHACFTKAA